MARRNHQQWEPGGQPVYPLWSNAYWSITLLGRIREETDDNRILKQLPVDRLKGSRRDALLSAYHSTVTNGRTTVHTESSGSKLAYLGKVWKALWKSPDLKMRSARLSKGRLGMPVVFWDCSSPDQFYGSLAGGRIPFYVQCCALLCQYRAVHKCYGQWYIDLFYKPSYING